MEYFLVLIFFIKKSAVDPHNFIDGLVIAATYMVDITLGIVATISILFHEITQEIADFGVLLYSGVSKKKALILGNLII